MKMRCLRSILSLRSNIFTFLGSAALKKTIMSLGVSRFSTFVFLDLETTGFKPPVQITELSMVAAEREHILLQSSISPKELPRVLDKFTVCVQPTREIESFASMITQMSNEDLQKKKVFDIELGRSVLSFIRRQAQPVCLVAHNGDNFDFKVLLSELETVGLSLPESVQGSDSLKAFRKQHKEAKSENDHDEGKRNGKRFSCSLANLHETFVGGTIENAHSAEGDALALLRLAIHNPEVLDYLESAAHKLGSDKKESLPKAKARVPLEEVQVSQIQDEYFTQLEKEGLL